MAAAVSDFFNKLDMFIRVDDSSSSSTGSSPTCWATCWVQEQPRFSIDPATVMCDGADGELRALTEQELDSVAYPDALMRINCNGVERCCVAPEGQQHFTVRNLVGVVEAFERDCRAATAEQFGFVDRHNVLFRGLHLNADGSFRVEWGS